MFPRVLIVVYMLLISACHAQNPDVIVHDAIPYCKGGNRDLLLDLMEPVDRQIKRPAILFVHGGGWMMGSREDYRDLMGAVASRGYVAASIEYRFSQEAVFPAQVEDVKCAVRWLRAHADEYAVDVDHIGAVGASAGAHLVSMAGATQNTQEFEGQGGYPAYSDDIQAMVLHGGVYDLSPAMISASIRENAHDLIFALLGKEASKDPQAFNAASPIAWVTRDLPPSLILHGQDDPIVASAQSVLMADKIKAAGAQTRLIIIPQSGHADFGKNPMEMVHIFFEFLDENLKVQK